LLGDGDGAANGVDRSLTSRVLGADGACARDGVPSPHVALGVGASSRRIVRRGEITWTTRGWTTGCRDDALVRVRTYTPGCTA